MAKGIEPSEEFKKRMEKSGKIMRGKPAHKGKVKKSIFAKKFDKDMDNE